MSASEFITVNGVKLECAWFGPPRDGGVEIVLLHEGLGCVALWRDFPMQLAVRLNRPVFAYSRQGYGGSDPSELPKDTSYMHDEGLTVLPALLAVAGIDDYVLFGHSDGASISLIYAGGTPAPGLRALVLEAPHVFTENVSHDSIRAAKTAYRDTDLRAKLAKYHGDNVDCAFYGWADPWTEDAFWQWDLTEFLPDINVPILLIQGEDDEYGTAKQLIAIEAEAGGAVTLLLIPDCGHSPHRDQPAAVLNHAVNFIRAQIR